MAGKITQNTLLPMAMVVGICVFIATVATDRARALSQIEAHEKRIASVEQKIDDMADGVRRLETKLGTLPTVPTRSALATKVPAGSGNDSGG